VVARRSSAGKPFPKPPPGVRLDYVRVRLSLTPVGKAGSGRALPASTHAISHQGSQLLLPTAASPSGETVSTDKVALAGPQQEPAYKGLPTATSNVAGPHLEPAAAGLAAPAATSTVTTAATAGGGDAPGSAGPHRSLAQSGLVLTLLDPDNPPLFPPIDPGTVVTLITDPIVDAANDAYKSLEEAAGTQAGQCAAAVGLTVGSAAVGGAGFLLAKKKGGVVFKNKVRTPSHWWAATQGSAVRSNSNWLSARACQCQHGRCGRDLA
jgi:hypothetical protein